MVEKNLFYVRIKIWRFTYNHSAVLKRKHKMQKKKSSNYPYIYGRQDYSIMSPKGKIFKFKDLPKFIREHRKEFTPYELEVKYGKTRAHNGLFRITPWNKRRVGTWHGWTWYSENKKDVYKYKSIPRKNYSIKSPRGKIFKFVNLREFIEEHPEEFSPYDLVVLHKISRAYCGLSSLVPREKSRSVSWHGWTWYARGVKNAANPKCSPKKKT